MRFSSLLTCRKHLHVCIISQSGEVWAHKTGLTQPLLIEVTVPSQGSELSCISVLGVSILPVSSNSSDYVIFFFLLYYSRIYLELSVSKFKIVLLTYPDTKSFGISVPRPSAISRLPILATHCNANVTCIGLRLDKSFFIAWITNFIKSLWALIITDINKYPWNKQQIFVFLSDQISLVHICVSFSKKSFWRLNNFLQVKKQQ